MTLCVVSIQQPSSASHYTYNMLSKVDPNDAKKTKAGTNTQKEVKK